eukprot:COSAG06_NODE_26120_length_621_cov_0.749042_1_plen_81_part_00
MAEKSETVQPWLLKHPRSFNLPRQARDPHKVELNGVVFCLQDGLINRLLIEQEGVSLLPRCPRAFHAGANTTFRTTATIL